MHDHSWADANAGDEQFLGEIFSLAFVRDVDPLDAMRRVGGLADTLADRTPDQIAELHEYEHGYPEVVSALSLGEWTVLFQPTGFWLELLVDALSRGTETLALVRHDYATPRYSHAVDGTLVTGFHLNYPDNRRGTEPDRYLALMREAGFDPDDDEGQYDEAVSRALRLVELITGVAPTFEQLTGPLPSMHFDHWFSRTRPSRLDTTPATEEIVAELGLGGTPGLSDALAAAERGERVVITPESELGLNVREWLTTARKATWSTNDPGARHNMNDEERHRAHRLAVLTEALAAKFRPDLA